MVTCRFKMKSFSNKETIALNEEPIPVQKCEVFYNEFKYAEHGCLINNPSGRPHCQLKDLQIDLSKVQSDVLGGEPLESMVNKDVVTSLSYSKGAFMAPKLKESFVPNGSFHYLKDVFESLGKSGRNPKCDQTWPGITLFITRYEYVNLFHTMTDWWNLFFALPSTTKATNVVLLDARSQGGLDGVWKKLVRGGNVIHIRRMGTSKSNLCFQEARFVPPGYSSPLYYRPRSPEYSHCSNPKMMESFVKYFLEVHESESYHRVPGRIVVLDRIPYLDHPNRDVTRIERSLSNLRSLADSLPDKIQPLVGKSVEVTVQVETMSNLTMQEQLKVIREADVLLGNHGAGLTHGIFLNDGALMIEMTCQYGFFPELMSWKPRVTHLCERQVHGSIPDYYWERIVDKIGSHIKGSTG